MYPSAQQIGKQKLNLWFIFSRSRVLAFSRSRLLAFSPSRLLAFSRFEYTRRRDQKSRRRDSWISRSRFLDLAFSHSRFCESRVLAFSLFWISRSRVLTFGYLAFSWSRLWKSRVLVFSPLEISCSRVLALKIARSRPKKREVENARKRDGAMEFRTRYLIPRGTRITAADPNSDYMSCICV